MNYFNEKKILDEEILPVGPEKMKEILHRSIGGLTFVSGFQLNAGTGTILSPDILLTVAHNIYNRENKSESKNVKFYPGANGQTEHFCQIIDYKYPEEFRTCRQDQRHKFDYAILKLKDKIIMPEYLPIVVVDRYFPISQVVARIYGYPVIKDNFKALDEEGKKIYIIQYGLARSNRVILDFQQSQIRYMISSYKGQSGCPIVMQGGIVGVHIGGGGSSKDFNIGRLVDHDLVRSLRRWCNELKATSIRVQGEHKSENAFINQRHLELKNSDLKWIYLNAYVNLLQLFIPGNQLQTIDLSLNKQLQTLDLSRNKLTIIDLSKNKKLLSIFLDDNRLEFIDLQDNLTLKTIQLQSNKLQVLNVTSNLELIQLRCGCNCLREIDLKNNTNLARLRIQENSLTTVDLSRNTDLTELNLYENQLYSINLRANLGLKVLKLQANQLEEIDLTSLEILEELSLFKNRLSSIRLYVSHDVPVYKYNEFRLQGQRSKTCKIELRSNGAKCEQVMSKWNSKLMSEGSNQNSACKYEICRI